jgi:hypothetical protein
MSLMVGPVPWNLLTAGIGGATSGGGLLARGKARRANLDKSAGVGLDLPERRLLDIGACWVADISCDSLLGPHWGLAVDECSNRALSERCAADAGGSAAGLRI